MAAEGPPNGRPATRSTRGWGLVRRGQARTPNGPCAYAARWLLGATAAVALAGCIVVPQTREVYDAECRVLTRQMTLETAYLGGFQRCAGDGCLALLSAAGAVTAASAVVSGSIALVGNVVYWFERQGQCLRASGPPPPAASEPLGPAASAPK